MNVDRLLVRTATITSVSMSGAADVFGDPSESTTATTASCYIEQKQASDTTAGQSVGSEEWLCVFPAGTSIDQNDRIVVDGATYQVYGPPWTVANPRLGSTGQVECTLRRTP